MSIHSLPEPAIKSTLTLSVSMSRSKLIFTLRESRLGPFPGACLDYIHSLKAHDSGVVIPPVWWWFPLCGGEQRGRYQPQLVAPPHQRFCDVAAVCCCCQLSVTKVPSYFSSKIVPTSCSTDMRCSNNGIVASLSPFIIVRSWSSVIFE